MAIFSPRRAANRGADRRHRLRQPIQRRCGSRGRARCWGLSSSRPAPSTASMPDAGYDAMFPNVPTLHRRRRDVCPTTPGNDSAPVMTRPRRISASTRNSSATCSTTAT